MVSIRLLNPITFGYFSSNGSYIPNRRWVEMMMAKIQTSDQPAEARYFPDGLVLSLSLSLSVQAEMIAVLLLLEFGMI